jgi:hypothetical protein
VLAFRLLSFDNSTPYPFHRPQASSSYPEADLDENPTGSSQFELRTLNLIVDLLALGSPTATNTGTSVQNWHFDDDDDIIRTKKSYVGINKIFDAIFSLVLYFVIV